MKTYNGYPLDDLIETLKTSVEEVSGMIEVMTSDPEKQLEGEMAIVEAVNKQRGIIEALEELQQLTS